MQTRLSLSSLNSLSSHVLKPAYQRGQLSPGILHIGVGNFHRAHQGVYLDELFSMGLDHDWAIVGAGLLAGDKQRRELLASQDWLTTIIEKDDEESKSRVIGSTIDFCQVSPSRLLEYLCNPQIRIVTLTITEGGYYINADTDTFDVQHPDIQSDISNFDSPKSVFGLLLKALLERKKSGVLPFTILSCDNLIANGQAAYNAIFGLANNITGIDIPWLESELACPNCMVDCITPASGDVERRFIREHYGFVDEAPVICEPFRQWVIEDHFCNGRPQLERVGVEFTSNVHPYEELKLNILNAGHAAIAYPSALLGIEYANEAMADADISAWLKTLISREVAPTLKGVSNITPESYFDQVYKRFKNTALKDSISRLCDDGENRQPKFIFTSIYRALEKGTPIDGLALEVAFWCRYVAENKIGESSIWQSALATKDNSIAFVSDSGVFGELSTNEVFLRCFGEQIKRLWAQGVRKSLQSFINDSGN